MAATYSKRVTWGQRYPRRAARLRQEILQRALRRRLERRTKNGGSCELQHAERRASQSASVSD